LASAVIKEIHDVFPAHPHPKQDHISYKKLLEQRPSWLHIQWQAQGKDYAVGTTKVGILAIYTPQMDMGISRGMRRHSVSGI
jgi:hypothetical protein